jgi:hypothetical protein
MIVPTPRPLPTVPPNSGFPPPSSARQLQQQTRQATPPPAAAQMQAPQPVATATAAPTPQATPTALSQANVFVYGSPPPSTFAAPGDAPQIFYATFSPTVLNPNTTVKVSAVTTTNVQRLTIGTGSTNIALSPLGTGLWQGVFSTNALNLPATATTVQLSLIASRNDGQSATIPIPVSLLRNL